MSSDHEKLIELVGVVSENVVQPFDRHSNRNVVAKAQVDHSRVRLALTKDEFAKVAVIGDQDAPLGVREAQHFSVRQAWRMLAADADRVVAEKLKMRDQASVTALVEQESHVPSADALAVNWRSGRRPIILACAYDSAA